MSSHCGQQKQVFILFRFLDETVSQVEKSFFYSAAAYEDRRWRQAVQPCDTQQSCGPSPGRPLMSRVLVKTGWQDRFITIRISSQPQAAWNRTCQVNKRASTSRPGPPAPRCGNSAPAPAAPVAVLWKMFPEPHSWSACSVHTVTYCFVSLALPSLPNILSSRYLAHLDESFGED